MININQKEEKLSQFEMGKIEQEINKTNNEIDEF